MHEDGCSSAPLDRRCYATTVGQGKPLLQVVLVESFIRSEKDDDDDDDNDEVN